MRQHRNGGFHAPAMVGALLVASLTPSTGWTQLSSYLDFQNLTPAQLERVAVKLTYAGALREAVPTVAFTSASNPLDLKRFVPFRRAGLSYLNDTRPARQFDASTPELQAVLQHAGSIPAVRVGGVASAPVVSFAVFDGASGKAFEAVLDKAEADTLLAGLRNVFFRNRAAVSMITNFGCATALREPGAPSDVTSNVEVTYSGLRLNRATGRFVGTATLKNHSPAAISGPLSLVLEVESGVQIGNAAGFTCQTSPVGTSYLKAAGSSLDAGGTIQVNIELNNPDSRPFKPTHRILAGAGAR